MFVCVLGKAGLLQLNRVNFNFTLFRGKKYIPLYTEIVKYKQQFAKKAKQPSKPSTDHSSKESAFDQLSGGKDAKSYDGTETRIKNRVEGVINLKHPVPTTIPNIHNLFQIISKSSLEGAKNRNKTENEREIHLNLFLNLDIRRTSLRGNMMLPFVVSNKKKILAICEKEEEQLALKSGATYAGLSYLDRIESGWMDFDLIVTTSIFMPKLVKLARILGPKKLMPNSKSGTLCNNLIGSIKSLSSSNSVQYRAEALTQDEFSLLTQILNFNSNFSSLKTDLEDKKSLELSKIVVPISLLNSSKDELTANIKHFTQQLFEANVTVTKRETQQDFVYPPARKNLLFGSRENKDVGSSSQNDFILSIALNLQDYQNHLFFLNSVNF